MPKFRVELWHTVMDIVSSTVDIEAETVDAAIAAAKLIDRSNLEFEWSSCVDCPASAYEEGYEVRELTQQEGRNAI